MGPRIFLLTGLLFNAHPNTIKEREKKTIVKVFSNMIGKNSDEFVSSHASWTGVKHLSNSGTMLFSPKLNWETS